MSELIPTDTNQRMSSLDIAELTGKKHNKVMRDIRSLIDQGAINESSFGLVEYKDAKGESRPMYLLDFKATMTLITGYDAVRRSKVIDRWADLESGAATPVPAGLPNFNNPIESARAWADVKEGEQAALKQIEADRPKVEFYEAVEATEQTVEFSLFAKAVSRSGGFIIGRNRLYGLLREKNILMDGYKSKNMPYQRYVDQGWFEVTERNYENTKSNGPRVYFMTLITGKGQIAITKMLQEHFNRAA